MKTPKKHQGNCKSDPIQIEINNTQKNILKYQQLVSKRPNTYLSKIADLQHMLARIYWYDCNDDELAEKMFLQALETYDKYSGHKRNIPREKITIMECLISLYNRSNRLDLSEHLLLRILEIQKELVQKNELLYIEDLAVTQWRLGNLYIDMQHFNAAEQMYLTVLNTRAKFDDEDIYRYRSATAQCQRSLGNLYENYLSEYSKAEAYYLKSVEILQELCENKYERCNFIRSLQISYLLLAELYEKMGNLKMSKKYHSLTETCIK